MSELINPAFSKAFQKDKTVGMPLFDSAAERTPPPMVKPRSNIKNATYYGRVADGTLAASRLKVLAIIKRYGINGCTIQQLNEMNGVPINEASGRTSELVALGHVLIIGKVMNEKTKRPNTLYRAKDLCLPTAASLPLLLKKK